MDDRWIGSRRWDQGGRGEKVDFHKRIIKYDDRDEEERDRWRRRDREDRDRHGRHRRQEVERSRDREQGRRRGEARSSDRDRDRQGPVRSREVGEEMPGQGAEEGHRAGQDRGRMSGGGSTDRSVSEAGHQDGRRKKMKWKGWRAR